jgi:hypothetical protein
MIGAMTDFTHFHQQQEYGSTTFYIVQNGSVLTTARSAILALPLSILFYIHIIVQPTQSLYIPQLTQNKQEPQKVHFRTLLDNHHHYHHQPVETTKTAHNGAHTKSSAVPCRFATTIWYQPPIKMEVDGSGWVARLSSFCRDACIHNVVRLVG